MRSPGPRAFWRPAAGPLYHAPGIISPDILLSSPHAASIMHTILRRIAVPAVVLAFSTAVPAHAQPADASALSGRWTGTYECGQGTTALDLSLRGNAHGIVQGRFEFSATSQNPDVPAGAYPVMGRFTGTSLVLRPIDARYLPEGYGPVGVQATVSGRRMTGVVNGPGCGALMLTRAETARPDQPLAGGYGQQEWATVAEAEAGHLFMDVREWNDMGASTDLGWMRWESRTGPGAGETTEWEVEFDCDARLVRVWHELIYGVDGQLMWLDSSYPQQWVPITEGSMFDRVWDHACGGALLPES
jgi:hypothetical protein